MNDPDSPSLEEMISRFEEKRKRLLSEVVQGHTVRLPLKYLRQQAHYTTPASNYEMACKAVEKGSSAAARILEKFRITTDELSTLLEIPRTELEEELARDPHAPLVMIDSEDAQALREDVILRGRRNAGEIFGEAHWGQTLRFYRPSGFNLDYSIPDLVEVLSRSAQGIPPERFPIDGIVWPKPEHPEEISFVCEMLEEMERKLGLARNRIKLEFLVESGWSAAQLPLLVKAALPRLAGIIFGIADYSADIGLPGIVNNHPVCDWTRAAIVNIAGAVGVPAIDNMTMNYPVASPKRSAEENRTFILQRIREVFQDTRHGIELGMDGKWVGHPLQLFVVRLAFRLALPEEEVRRETEKLLCYAESVAKEKGTTIIQDVMTDRATDRHTRTRLRKAIALGLLDTGKGLALGLISREEYEAFSEPVR
jgi:citrate lyase beta subunit